MIRTIRTTRKNTFFLNTVSGLGFLLPALLVSAALAAGPVYWDWPEGRGFAELERQGLTLDQDGHLVRGLDSRDVGPAGPEVFWTLADDGQGGAYLGSGHGGEIYHLDRDGGQLLVAQLEGTEVFSVLALGKGVLLAGCGPDGHLYRVDGQGKTELLGQVGGGYIWALARRPGTQEVWLACGSPAAVWRLDGSGQLQQVCTLPAQNCLALEFTEAGELLLGTQGPGLVCRLDPRRPQQPDVIFQTPQDEVRQFATGPEEGLFFLSLNSGDESGVDDVRVGNGKGGQEAVNLLSFFEPSRENAPARSALYRLDGNRVEAWWSSDLDLMKVAWSERWGWLAGGPLDEAAGQAFLHRLTGTAGHQPLLSWPGGDLLDILVLPGGDGQRILVAQAHPGTVHEVGLFAEERPAALSPPLDAGQMVQWGRLRFSSQGQADGLRWSARTGNHAVPDHSWSDWSAAWDDPDHALELPAGRFLQWKVEFPSGKELAVTGVSVSAWQDNLRPVVRDLVLEKVKGISLGGMMNGSENVTQSFRSGLKAEFSRNSQRSEQADGARAASTRPVRVFSWQGQDPNGDRLVYRLEYATAGRQNWREIIGRTEETLGSWDTSDVPDGTYRVRVTATDDQDNPLDLALSSHAETGSITVDNTPPVIKGFTLKAKPGGFSVQLTAEDTRSSLAGAVIQLPDGTRQRLDPVDRICDSRQEKFAATVSWPQAGLAQVGLPWAVRVEVRDLAGNLAAAEGEINAESGAGQ